ncbi:hypothetical protein WR25_04995 [Diploscapter pachys]|uniref:Uncharacterized protein n=1 Tax=Diploscapter pachys TaxID=2018661 RepID=A0A2A2J4M5_9BILA|nr:hypothetical protein WR25_04995 [Diploscapter pachys]
MALLKKQEAIFSISIYLVPVVVLPTVVPPVDVLPCTVCSVLVVSVPSNAAPVTPPVTPDGSHWYLLYMPLYLQIEVR